MLTTGQAVHDPSPSPSVSASRKKQKMNPSAGSQSFGGPPAPFHPQPAPPLNLPSSSAARRGPLTGTKAKNKKSVRFLILLLDYWGVWMILMKIVM